ncbi:MAG: PAS domain S-box protein [Rhodocyclaceae bacterium]|nr:PAS domain S-box protein [Rhodocyclaceae bacterium]MDZ4213927.1 PAS domain S-box protein [Rhodocyclaceae bacterium]
MKNLAAEPLHLAASVAESQNKSAHPSEKSVGGRPVEKLLHELQVHQIELEMQNETLRLTQLSLEEARDRYQDLYEFAPVGYLTLTPQGLITEINLAGANFLGMERKKVLQKSFTSFVAREDQDRWVQHYSRMSESEGQKSFAFELDLELALKRSDNTLLHAQLNCMYHRSVSSGLMIRVALTDITQRKHAENERKHNARRIESFMRHANDAILMFDANSRIIDASDSCLNTYGHTRKELLGMRLMDLRAPDTHLDIPAILQQLSEQGSMSYQTWHCRADGSSFPVQVGATMVEIDGSSYVQKIVRDDSKALRQRSVMESGLATASRRLLELSRHLVEAQEDARRRLSGELHDHTSPNLAAIKINLGMITTALPPDAPSECVDRLADTIALIEDTDVSIREICADLRSPILDYAGLPAAMEEYAHRYASRTGILVHVHCSNRETRLAPALESLLFRIFQEALTNSLKHAKARHINVAIDFDAIPILLTIDDDGIGFDIASVESKASVSGMGLLNMREMAEFAGGQMIIESHPGQGTRINVSIQA